jgi:hypothetical protein
MDHESPLTDEIKNLIPYTENDTLKLQHSNGSSIELYPSVTENIVTYNYNGEMSCYTENGIEYIILFSNSLDSSFHISWKILTLRNALIISTKNQGRKYNYNKDTIYRLYHDTLSLNGSLFKQVYEINFLDTDNEEDSVKTIFYNYIDKLLKIEFVTGEYYFGVK